MLALRRAEHLKHGDDHEGGFILQERGVHTFVKGHDRGDPRADDSMPKARMDSDHPAEGDGPAVPRRSRDVGDPGDREERQAETDGPQGVVVPDRGHGGHGVSQSKQDRPARPAARPKSRREEDQMDQRAASASH